ncbi:MAG: undecaprenyl/decaprenyl-phosphate alpha-N-acetylglucosaminyl 1-phosphate transferase [Phycisphaerales bacterium]|jgi:UDP-GlcNAc:undecaprenyl-phosphate GlcNAc-1-phosphate transferase|nr:undecaprenyl/decaprenyl-phosphate alpha-N-acetylglucosaminyl 1-phosphate transferase [Phycisphaerales bacterium]
MVLVVLSLIAASFVIALPATWLAVILGRKLGALDSAGVAGQVKLPPRRIPNTGGVAIFGAIMIPLLGAIAVVGLVPADTFTGWLEPVRAHLPGLATKRPAALTLAACLALLHLVGLFDDRRALGPKLKLVIMLGVAAATVWFSDTRLLTFLDDRVGGPWLSILVTVLWIIVVTNALNFLDNMDGLAGGVALIAAACFLAGALVQGQWFVAACLSLLVGSLAGFLVFNFPPAKIFMGDGGSLVIGFLLAFLTVRTTYIGEGPAGTNAWYGVLMPVVVLAVPLYDFTTVTILRLSQGKSPMVGDLQHVSHRFVGRGMSKQSAVLVIWGLTACTGIAGIFLGSLEAWKAALVGIQVVMALVVLAAFEHATGWRGLSASPPREPDQTGEEPRHD